MTHSERVGTREMPAQQPKFAQSSQVAQEGRRTIFFWHPFCRAPSQERASVAGACGKFVHVQELFAQRPASRRFHSRTAISPRVTSAERGTERLCLGRWNLIKPLARRSIPQGRIQNRLSGIAAPRSVQILGPGSALAIPGKKRRRRIRSPMCLAHCGHDT